MVKIFADGANMDDMIRLYNDPKISGLTTNPTLMKKAGIADYKEWALRVLSVVKEKPISFEVFADDINTMYQQAMEISSWSRNVYVKIPITTTNGETTSGLIERLSKHGCKVNVTAITTLEQVCHILSSFRYSAGGYISVFAGRIADTGVDPLPIMKSVLYEIKLSSFGLELIWASPREVLNVVQASDMGCHIITCTPDIIKKLPLLGKDLTEYSLETVRMFYEDGKGFKI